MEERARKKLSIDIMITVNTNFITKFIVLYKRIFSDQKLNHFFPEDRSYTFEFCKSSNFEFTQSSCNESDSGSCFIHSCKFGYIHSIFLIKHIFNFSIFSYSIQKAIIFNSKKY